MYVHHVLWGKSETGLGLVVPIWRWRWCSFTPCTTLDFSGAISATYWSWHHQWSFLVLDSGTQNRISEVVVHKNHTSTKW